MRSCARETRCCSTRVRASRSSCCPKEEVEELVLEEIPDVSYEDIGGLEGQIEAIRDAVELPFLYAELFHEHELEAPKGVLLYGPPGCGKTLIAKAVAKSLAEKVAERTGRDDARSYFLNVKGPELLNKYVGETERQIREIFQRAKERSEEGLPVIVFFDEMDSIFRTRGTGISSRRRVDDRAAAAVGARRRRDPQERDRDRRLEPRGPDRPGDPAARPPGREDQDRASRRGRRPSDIMAKYLHPVVPIHPDEIARNGGDAPLATLAHDREDGRADVRAHRPQPVPRGHVRVGRQGDPRTSRTSTRAP